MLKTVKNNIEKHKLLTPNAKVIVGLSGGADSVVLLHVLHLLGYECIAAHCNFCLRGEESVRDERSAEQWAASLRIPFHKRDFNTSSVAKERGVSIEMAARDLRYEWFETLRQELQAEAVAVAHHCDDSIETLLLNLIRGTGIAGLTGIKPKNGCIVRPLLCVSKEEIVHYAQEENLPFIVDSSNLQEEFTRNKIRRRLVPLLKSLNPGLDLSLLRTMKHLSEVEKIYHSHIAEAKNRVFNSAGQSIDIPALLAYPSPEAILFEILKEYGFGKDVIENVCRAVESQSGKEFYSKEYKLIKDRKHFFLHPVEQNEADIVFHIEANETEIAFPFPMTATIRQEEPVIDKDKNTAWFDFDKLRFPLIIRKWRKGDRFVPFGMKGSQKLSDYFNDHKLNNREKENAWILCSGNDIIWIVGRRTDNRFRIEKDTKQFYILKLL